MQITTLISDTIQMTPIGSSIHKNFQEMKHKPVFPVSIAKHRENHALIHLQLLNTLISKRVHLENGR